MRGNGLQIDNKLTKTHQIQNSFKKAILTTNCSLQFHADEAEQTDRKGMGESQKELGFNSNNQPIY